MKKIIYKFIIFICLLCLTSCSVSAKEVETQQFIYDMQTNERLTNFVWNETTSSGITLVHTNTIYQDTFASHYFMNLTSNYGYNVKGSCTFIALDMILSFLDTFWDDSFIPENYDMNTILDDDYLTYNFNSPGVYGEDYGLVSGQTTEEYYKTVEKYSNFYHHLKLIEIGKRTETLRLYNYDEVDNPCGLTDTQLLSLTRKYLTDSIGKIENVDIMIAHESGDTSSKAFTINNIINGIPVILRAGNGSSGHAMVAYDYDSNTDTIYVHPGWRGEQTHITLDSTSFDNIWDATAIIPLTDHVHTNNFKYINKYVTTETFCPCTIHNHSYTSRFEDYSGTSHRAYCVCGYYDYINHAYNTATYDTASTHIAHCVCGHDTTEAHSYDHNYVYQSNTYHKAYCKCNDYELENHVAAAGSVIVRNGHNYARCISCNVLIDLGTGPIEIIIESLRGNIVTENGSYILPGGILMLVDEDIEAYLNGTLEFIVPGQVSA